MKMGKTEELWPQNMVITNREHCNIFRRNGYVIGDNFTKFHGPHGPIGLYNYL